MRAAASWAPPTQGNPAFLKTCDRPHTSFHSENSYAYAPDPYLPPSMLSTDKYVD